MRKYKTIFGVLHTLAVIVTILHFIFLGISAPTVDIQSMILNILPYGLPILLFALARRACVEDKPLWSKAGFLMMTLFALTFLAMSVHVTLAFFYSKESFINVYFNVPFLYSAVLLLFGVLWLGIKNRVSGSAEKTVVGKVLSASIALILIAMSVHVVAVSVMEIMRQINGPLTTSAPWWLMPLLIAFAYIAAAGVMCLIRGIYNRVKGR